MAYSYVIYTPEKAVETGVIDVGSESLARIAGAEDRESGALAAHEAFPCFPFGNRRDAAV